MMQKSVFCGLSALSITLIPREFGIRRAVGSTPQAPDRCRLGRRADCGVRARRPCGRRLRARAVAERILGTVRLPGALPVMAAAVVLIGAATVASLLPARRASRIDVLQALRSE